ncbi:hypothetical protein FS749_009625 [Ceratobasidium sp. UAMH 11750]|nr:hypothetical protein FS749_009625 [Ceratobasidium sp. UAMH 11750]
MLESSVWTGSVGSERGLDAGEDMGGPVFEDNASMLLRGARTVRTVGVKNFVGGVMILLGAAAPDLVFFALVLNPPSPGLDPVPGASDLPGGPFFCSSFCASATTSLSFRYPPLSPVPSQIRPLPSRRPPESVPRPPIPPAQRLLYHDLPYPFPAFRSFLPDPLNTHQFLPSFSPSLPNLRLLPNIALALARTMIPSPFQPYHSHPSRLFLPPPSPPSSPASPSPWPSPRPCAIRQSTSQGPHIDRPPTSPSPSNP